MQVISPWVPKYPLKLRFFGIISALTNTDKTQDKKDSSELNFQAISGLDMQPAGCLYCKYAMEKDSIFKALADPTRRLILDELSERKEQTLYELCARLIMKHNVTMSRQAITKHLSILEEAGLVKSKRKGRYKLLIFNNAPIKKIGERWLKL